MAEWEHRPWYHGSQQRLATLRVGSSVTQKCPIARAFSHRPSIVSMEDDGTVRHDGLQPGYLYRVVEEVRPDDVYPHPHPSNASRWEWLTARELRLELLEETRVREEDILTAEARAHVLQQHAAAGDGQSQLSS